MILIIDDSVPLSKLYHSILIKEGFDSVALRSGSEALNFLKKNPRPKLIFLDCSMPLMTGEDFLDELEAAIPSIHSETKIIGFSSYSVNEPSIQNFQNRVFKYVEKPSDRETFLNVVRTSL